MVYRLDGPGQGSKSRVNKDFKAKDSYDTTFRKGTR